MVFQGPLSNKADSAVVLVTALKKMLTAPWLVKVGLANMPTGGVACTITDHHHHHHQKPPGIDMHINSIPVRQLPFRLEPFGHSPAQAFSLTRGLV